MDLFKAFKHPQAQVASNAFDLSFRNVITTKAGTLRPIMCKEVVPGDKFKISAASLCRTFPMQTAPFLRCKQNFDFFFVPYTQLWSGWEDFISQRLDPTVSQPSQDWQPTPVLPFVNATYVKARLQWMATNSYVDNTGCNGVNQAMTLLADLGYGTGAMKFDDADNFTAPAFFDVSRRMNAFPLMAYHKIFYDYYSNPDYTVVRPEFFNADAAEFNHGNDMINYLDYFYGDDSTKYNFFLPHQRTYKKDLFMSVLPNQQFGLVSGVTSDDFDLYVAFNGSIPTTNALKVVEGTPNQVGTAGSLSSTGLVRQFNTGSSNLFDVLSLRRAEAFQVWKERTLRAGRRYNSQQKAHFGVDSKYTHKQHCERLGSFDSIVNVDEVVSTANGSAAGKNSLLGDIAGKGISAGRGQEIDFEAQDFGILMCIYSVVPEAEYVNTMVDKLVMKSTAFDFYTPEFANLGLHAMESCEVSVNINSHQDGKSFVWGYLPAYYEYKSSVDKVQSDTYGSADLAPWTSYRVEFNNELQGFRERDLYINPKVLDSIFGFGANAAPDTDQFITAVQFNIQAIRKMSVIGTPQY